MKPANESCQRYADEVRRFPVCLTGDLELAEELVRETLCQAVKSIGYCNGTRDPQRSVRSEPPHRRRLGTFLAGKNSQNHRPFRRIE